MPNHSRQPMQRLGWLYQHASDASRRRPHARYRAGQIYRHRSRLLREHPILR